MPDQLTASEQALLAALDRALRDNGGQLQLHYQPQIRLADGALHGVEALARWQHPELGELAPDFFVPLAERGGLIARFGAWAVREGCHQLARWRGQGLAVPSISVNLSPLQFREPELADAIAAVLRDSGVPPVDLTIEITESVYMDDAALQVLRSVHQLGVQLAIDDFGTGYSSLARLRDMPAHELKLDRSFLAGIEHDKRVRALMQAVLGIGESLNLAIVAEGVETPAQRDFLIACGCGAAQGYLWSEPLTARGFEDWLARRRQGA